MDSVGGQGGDVLMAVAAPTRSTYDVLAERPLDVEDYRLERREVAVSSGWVRPTTTVTLSGAGVFGQGEDAGYDIEDHNALAAAPPLALGSSFTLASFSRLLNDLPLSPVPPLRAHSAYFRRWVFESPALDLALRQADSRSARHSTATTARSASSFDAARSTPLARP